MILKALVVGQGLSQGVIKLECAGGDGLLKVAVGEAGDRAL
jgi:hypothetical protein